MSEIAIRKRNGGETLSQVNRREWEPMRLLREMLAWDPFREIAPLVPPLGTFSPAFEVKETKDAFVFKADLPGVKEADVEVTVAGNRVTVSGKREAEKEEKNDTYYAYERSYGSFSRTFTLPADTDAAHVKAELKAGELTIAIPKSPAAVARRIPLEGGDKQKS